MTIRLLAAREVYGVRYPANAIVTLDAPTEAGLITAKEASSDLTGGAVFTPRRTPSVVSAWNTQNRSRAVEEMLAIGNDDFPPPSKGTLLTDWTNGTPTLASSNGGGEAISIDTSLLIDGIPSMRITLGNAGTYIADFVFTSPVTVAQLVSLQIPFRCSSNQTAFVFGNSPQVWLFTDATGTTQQFRIDSAGQALSATYQRAGQTHIISMLPGAAGQGWSFSGTPLPTSSSDMDALTINRLRFVFAVPSGVAGEKCWFGPIRRNGRRKALVSIVLDGNYDSQDKFMLPMCEAQGIRVSLAPVHSGIGLANRMTYQQIDRAYFEGGHEVVHHTFDGNVKTNGYASSSDWPTLADVQGDIQAGQANQIARGWTRGLGYAVHAMTHPFVPSVSAARQSLVSQAYANAGVKAIRAGLGRGNGQLQPICNPGLIDPYTICGAKQATSSDNAAALTAVVTRAKAEGAWAIFTFHQSVVSSPGSLQVLNSDFQTFITALGDDMRTGAVIVAPFAHACTLVGI